MEFSTKAVHAERHKGGCVVVGAFEGGQLTPSATALDRAAGKFLSQLAARGDLPGKCGSCAMLHQVPNIAAPRVLVVGLGKQAELKDKNYRDAVRAAMRALNQSGAADALVCLPEAKVADRDMAWKLEHAVLIAEETAYRFDDFKSKPGNNAVASRLKQLTFSVSQARDSAKSERIVKRAAAIANGIAFAKNLGNTPPNICTPTYLANQAKQLAKSHGLKVSVLEQAEMEKLGMNTLLSVSRGSRQPPKLIVLEHLGGKKKDKPVVLVGKGITFDTGGISIKPAPDMDEMKFDMSGAGSVLGTMKTLAEIKLPLNVIGVVPTCENMPDGSASRPGDIVTSMSGQTIEILNTDAEGRLILCDALTYVERFEPQAVIDIATLTGACVIALGHVVSGMYANDERLARDVMQAGDDAYDRVWRLPLHDDYQEQLSSNFADMANIGGRPAGSITAACFLARFAKKYHWAHLDIAGTAYKSGKEKGSTGRPVGLLAHFVMARAKLN